MSEEYVKIDRFEDHIKTSDKQFETLGSRLGCVEKELGTKVGWIVFWSIVLLLVGLVGGMWGILYNEVKSVKNTTVDVSADLSYLKGVLDKAEITK